jgi:D-sedoheptulose 7-phosphate isomerase
MTDRDDGSLARLTAAERRGELASRVRGLFQASIAVKTRVMESDAERIVEMAEVMAASLRQGGKVLFCGNGGSAADAQHLAAEMLVRLRPNIDRAGLPGIALAVDMSSLTAFGNDYGFEGYYARMVRALGRAGDILLGISTSGRSANIVRALTTGREQGLVTLGLLGSEGGQALAECDYALVVPAGEIGRVQETHIVVGHALIELVEDLLLDHGYLRRGGTVP